MYTKRLLVRRERADPCVTGIAQHLLAEGIITRTGTRVCKRTIHKVLHNRFDLGAIPPHDWGQQERVVDALVG